MGKEPKKNSGSGHSHGTWIILISIDIGNHIPNLKHGRARARISPIANMIKHTLVQAQSQMEEHNNNALNMKVNTLVLTKTVDSTNISAD
ncbi:hypothetical protein V1478_017599 [Vespula squamosa]|uniref:Uncharacterized protein n=1 Tax=Vespula squamosa TaxID=30214 RepID=A0ABD1ZXB9_VESSQ